MKYLMLLLPLMMFVVQPASAFKWSKCKKNFKYQPSQPASKGVGEMLLAFSVDYTSQAATFGSTSSTSYVSSTGDCAALAKADDERKMFIADSLTKLKVEAAEGQGEHLTSLATLYGCDGRLNSGFVNMLRSNGKLLSEQNDPSILHDQLMSNLLNVKELREGCNLGRI